METLEYAVILGGLETFTKHKPIIICELLKKSDPELTGAMICALEWIGYKFYRIEEKNRWEPYPANKVIENLNNKYPDWVLSPNGIPEEFYDEFFKWQTSVQECNETENTLVERGNDATKKLFTSW